MPDFCDGAGGGHPSVEWQANWPKRTLNPGARVEGTGTSGSGWCQ